MEQDTMFKQLNSEIQELVHKLTFVAHYFKPLDFKSFEEQLSTEIQKESLSWKQQLTFLDISKRILELNLNHLQSYITEKSTTTQQ